MSALVADSVLVPRSRNPLAETYMRTPERQTLTVRRESIGFVAILRAKRVGPPLLTGDA